MLNSDFGSLDPFENQDPFAVNDQVESSNFQGKVHLRLYKRNARKTITLIEGLDKYPEINLKKMLGYAKKKLSCNGNLKKTTSEDPNQEPETQILVQLQGDHRTEIKLMLQHRYHIDTRNIVIHGY